MKEVRRCKNCGHSLGSHTLMVQRQLWRCENKRIPCLCRINPY